MRMDKRRRLFQDHFDWKKQPFLRKLSKVKHMILNKN